MVCTFLQVGSSTWRWHHCFPYMTLILCDSVTVVGAWHLTNTLCFYVLGGVGDGAGHIRRCIGCVFTGNSWLITNRALTDTNFLPNLVIGKKNISCLELNLFFAFCVSVLWNIALFSFVMFDHSNITFILKLLFSNLVIFILGG